MNHIIIKPTCYSKFQTIKDIKDALIDYPEQLCNTVPAYSYTMEFVDYFDSNSPVGSLSEYFEETNKNDYVIMANNHKRIHVRRNSNGQFEVVPLTHCPHCSSELNLKSNGKKGCSSNTCHFNEEYD
jgi:hypothetical protein